jgi:small conductance mechanosensitive channel
LADKVKIAAEQAKKTTMPYLDKAETLADDKFEETKEAKDLITKVLHNNPKVLQTPKPEVRAKSLKDSAIHLDLRHWANNEYFSAVFTETLENCKTAFDAAGIMIQP